MYLVTMRCNVDDIAIRLFAEREPAVEFASTLGTKIDDSIMDIYKMDQSESLGIVLIGFDADGVPCSTEILKWFDE